MAYNSSAEELSPKVYVPTVALVALLVVQFALTQDWSTGEWYNTAAIVLQFLVGYLKGDPARA